MFDLHTHILPGIDDGPATLEESIEMAVDTLVDSYHALLAPSQATDA